jgi:fructose-bisphosphate aldolase class II
MALAVARTLAEAASVPVTLSLDHGKDPVKIRQAFRAGFSGLMIDASAFPLAENIRQTREVTALAASVGLCVEGELGHLADAPRYDHMTNADLMTPAADVALYRTDRIDLLAVSVGTAHGMYAPASRQRSISTAWRRYSASSVAGLHGGSGTPFEQLHVARNLGSQKSTLARRYLKRGKPRCCTPCATTAPLSWPMLWR